jgi:hypothetical protein
MFTVLLGLRVGQVRIIFSIATSCFPNGPQVPQHLAYVELFSAFTQPNSNHGMYKIKRCFDHDDDQERQAIIIPITDILRSVHLFPKCGPVIPQEWMSSMVLDECREFYVNSWSDRHAYIIIQ